jgi:hypothetical protein
MIYHNFKPHEVEKHFEIFITNYAHSLDDEDLRRVALECDACNGHGQIAWHGVMTISRNMSNRTCKLHPDEIIEDCCDCNGHGWVCACCRETEEYCDCGNKIHKNTNTSV